eukprot:871566-Pyramimonas_sp.AAC.1
MDLVKLTMLSQVSGRVRVAIKQPSDHQAGPHRTEDRESLQVVVVWMEWELDAEGTRRVSHAPNPGASCVRLVRRENIPARPASDWSVVEYTNYRARHGHCKIDR